MKFLEPYNNQLPVLTLGNVHPLCQSVDKLNPKKMANTIFFHKIVNNTIIVKTAVLSLNKKELNGQTTYSRQQGQVTYGLLCLCDADGNTINPQTLGLKKDQELKGYRLTTNPVLDQETGEETGMFWAE